MTGDDALRDRDEEWMRHALREARAAEALGEVPVGAVIVRGGEVVATGHNLTHTLQDPSAHAEMVAIRRAAQALGEWRLLDCTLYVTLEPCAMCSGAIVLARIPRLVFAAHDPKAGMSGSLANLVQHPRLNHRVQLTTGVLADEAGDLLRAFFRARRRNRVNPQDTAEPPPEAAPGATADAG
ncbi:tRNA adenosine(34) deaminase TadA [Longimicrobium sp.]|uniref:tRNA adenosine(34) deaminase TadA n=1 Tax=Longimicrobium sp. TaxID=2029185 RepID=UPI002E315A03|nr:tRNA adenosine(34) deaminase TadA [Longimicrobium sp.]HEX6036510.1 tRNA adenosine(34) deaminase TadA [Longimicrobium sp.]